MKDVQNTREASSPQKRTSSTSKQYIFHFFLFLRVILAHLDKDEVRIHIRNARFRIWIHQAKIYHMQIWIHNPD